MMVMVMVLRKGENWRRWRWRWRERERGGRGEVRKRETKRQREWSRTKTRTQNTYALARTTLEIAVGRLSEQAFISQEHARPTRNDGNSSSQVQQQRQHKTEKTAATLDTTQTFLRNIDATLPLLRPRPTCERLELRLSDDVVLSGFEDHRLFHCDQLTTRGIQFLGEILAEHVVDIRRIAANFRDAFERIQTSSSRVSGVDNFSTSQSLLQRRLRVLKIGILDLNEAQKMLARKNAGKWHFITLQEACDYVHAILHERVLCDSLRSLCGTLQQGHILPNVDVKSIYFHDTRRVLQDHTVEGAHCWDWECLVSRASFRRVAASGQTLYTILSLHINNVYAKRRKSSRPFVLLSLKTLIWLRTTSMVKFGVAAAVTISVLWMSLLLIAPCLRRWAPHRCGVLDPLSSTPVLSASGRWISMCFLYILKRSRSAREWSKLPSWDVASLTLRWLE